MNKLSIPALCVAATMALLSCKSNVVEQDIQRFPFITEDPNGQLSKGYLDPAGNTVIAARFKNVDIFSNGLALVEDAEGKMGFIDESGNYAIPAVYVDALGFSEGLAPVVREGAGCTYIDKTGAVKLDVPFAAQVGCFSDGMAIFEQDGKGGYINKEGAIAIPAQFWAASAFTEGLAAVSVDIVGGDSKFGYIDKKGNVKIQYRFDTAYPFQDGLAVVRENDAFGFIDNSGNYVIQPAFTAIRNFAYGLCPVSSGELWGYIDKKGKFAIAPKYDLAMPFAENGLAMVQVDGKFGYINRKGDLVIQPQHGFAASFYGSKAIAGTSTRNVGLIDAGGKYTVNPAFRIDNSALYPFVTAERRLVGLVRSDISTPRTAAFNWIRGVFHYDLPLAREYSSEQANELINIMAYSGFFKPEDLERMRRVRISILKVEELDDEATVTYQVSSTGDNEHILHLAKENGRWLVYFRKQDEFYFDPEQQSVGDEAIDTSSSHLLDDMPGEVE